MSRIFVCSPLRGPARQPAAENVALARRLMRAVFAAGHQPYVPHLLSPPVLTEASAAIERAFAANFSFLSVCEELWVFSADKAGCSRGMLREVEWAERHNAEAEVTSPGVTSVLGPAPKPVAVRFMPPAFETISRMLGENPIVQYGRCRKCLEACLPLNHAGWCFDCFSGVSR